ncbi:MAG: Trx7/PDZ domain-containing (seleno)protein [Isosphaeraceae bacterium]
MACSDFDGQVVRHDDEVAALAANFVCVRIQSMNGVDLNLFQFERDLTFMAFFMNNRDGVYTRYGGREDGDAESHLTKTSLLRIMDEVLRRHEAGEAPVEQPITSGQPPRTPESIPQLKPMLARRREQCIHCHDVKAAELRGLQELGTFRRELIFTYPMPFTLGLDIDPDHQQGVRSVQAGSPAANAGVMAGDTITRVGDRRVLTVGDMARVLEQLQAETKLPLELSRNGEFVKTTLTLSPSWKQTADPSWRPSIELAGPNLGFWAKQLSEPEKQAANLPADALALKVTFLFPNHPTPQEAGLRLGDVLIELDGRRNAWTTRQMHAYAQMNHEFGDKVPAVIQRNGKKHNIIFTFYKFNLDPK